MAVAKQELSIWDLFVLLVSIFVIGMSFFRSDWIVNILCVFIMFFLLNGQQKKNFLRRGAFIIAIIFLLGSLLVLSSGKARSYKNALIERALSLKDSDKLLKSRSLTIRYVENKYALEKIKDSFLFGVGMGSDYRPARYYRADSRNWIHNGYLAVILNLGIIGSALYFLTYFSAVYQLLKQYFNGQTSLFGKVILLTSILFLIKILVTGVVGPNFIRPHIVPLIAVFWGCAVLSKTKVMQKEEFCDVVTAH